MKETTKLIVSIAALGMALAGLILTTTNSLREDIREIRRDVQVLSDRVSRLEGLMQGVLAGRGATATVAQAPETPSRTAPTATE